MIKKAGYRLLISLFLLISIPSRLMALDVVEDIIRPAEELKGSPYVYGKSGPGTFDCSGLVYFLYKPLIPSIPRSSRDYRSYGQAVSAEQLQPGDLLLFATTGSPGLVSHIAIYIGQQSVIHAVSNGPETGVIVSAIDSGYWRRHFHSARRVLPSATVAPQKTRVTVTYERGRFVGPLKNGEPSGAGTMFLNNGDVYRGEFEDGLFNGEGTYTWKNGQSYTGRFEAGVIADPGQAPQSGETYIESDDSPWEDWDGEVYGDFKEWRSQEESAFEAFKARDKAGIESTLP